MVRRRLLVWVVCAVLALAWPVRAEEAAPAVHEREPILDLIEQEIEEGGEAQPMVDCSDGRPDRDCRSARWGATQATQTCNVLAAIFSSGNCSVHCSDGFYACGKCGFGGFAMCTCRESFTCNPHAP